MLVGRSTHQPANTRNTATPSSIAADPPSRLRILSGKSASPKSRRVLWGREQRRQVIADGRLWGDAEAVNQRGAAPRQNDAAIDHGEQIVGRQVACHLDGGTRVEIVEGMRLEGAGCERI